MAQMLTQQPSFGFSPHHAIAFALRGKAAEDAAPVAHEPPWEGAPMPPAPPMPEMQAAPMMDAPWEGAQTPAAPPAAPAPAPASTVAGITPELLDALRQVESSGGKRLRSEAGALGPYQLLPSTAKAYGVDPMNEEQSRWAAQEILKDGLQRYGGDVNKALMAYHAGDDNMSRHLAGQPSGVGPRTMAYPGKVMSAMRRSA
jgi:soluble lytic murein transglycosylase-like protein